jgi:ferredoxin
MAAGWHTCPHCKVMFVPQGNSKTCPACGQSLKEPRWYWARGEKRLGPAPVEQLRALVAAGLLSRTDRVRRSGTREWVAAGDVAEVFPRATPPPLPTTKTAPCEPAPVNAGPASRHETLSESHVVPDAPNCVQCGMCSYNCPMGIDVRAHAWRGKSIHDSHCLTCGECVQRCPRGVLRFERIALFTAKR